MAYCGKCGATINDGDVFCTNCGAPVQVNGTDDKNVSLDESKVKGEKKKQTKRKQASSGTQPKKRRATPKNQSFYDTSEDNNEELSLIKKIGLSIPIVCTGSGAYIGYEEGYILFAIVSAILFFIPIYVFNTPTAFRYTWWTVVFVLIGFVFSFTLINEHDNAQSAAQLSEINRKEDTIKAEEENGNDDMSKYLGRYNFSSYITMTQEMYFHIILNSDGTFTFDGSNEDTKSYMRLTSMTDGYNFPSGGKWERVKESGANGVFLDFYGNWGRGSLNFDNGVLEIPNMNGHEIKVRTRKN